MTSPSATPVQEPVLPGDLLARVREVRGVQRSAEVELLVLATEWADAHPALDQAPHAGARAARRADEAARATERRRIAAGWLADHDPDTPSDYTYDACSPDVAADPWVPQVAWDAVAPFAAAMGLSTSAGGRVLDDALFLRHRMPVLWGRALAGEVEAWRARRVAQAAWRRPADVVAALDAEVTPRAHSIGLTGLDRLVEQVFARLHPEEHELDRIAEQEARHVTVHPDPTPSGLADLVARADYRDAVDFDRACAAVAEVLQRRQAAAGMVPESLDVRRSRAIGILADPARALALLRGEPDSFPSDRPLAPGVVLHVHVSDAALVGSDPLARVAVRGVRGRGGAWRTQLAEAVAQWCGREASTVSVQPVIDLGQHRESGSPEPTPSLRTRTVLRRQSCAFPWCERPAAACDADHRTAAADGGPTCDCNLDPLCRRHHRLKTFAGWSYTPLETGPPDPRAGPPGPDHPGPAVSWLWRSPHGMAYLVDEHGTRDVTP